jgi:hypothetical protein
MSKKNRKRRAAAAVEPPAREGAGRVAVAAPARQPLAPGSPGAVGAYIGMLVGVGFVVLAVVGAVRADRLPVPLILAMLAAGAAEVLLCWRTLRRSRVAWSFAVALSGTIALACLFGAPKIRDAMEVGIAIAAIPTLLATLATVLMAMVAEEISSRV